MHSYLIVHVLVYRERTGSYRVSYGTNSCHKLADNCSIQSGHGKKIEFIDRFGSLNTNQTSTEFTLLHIESDILTQ